MKRLLLLQKAALLRRLEFQEIRIIFNILQIENLYPCGEGAGYAGGIVSAAMDGEKSCISHYCKNINKIVLFITAKCVHIKHTINFLLHLPTNSLFNEYSRTA